MGIIYKITNSINGKVYVGQTKYTVQHRIAKHIRNMNNELVPDTAL